MKDQIKCYSIILSCDSEKLFLHKFYNKNSIFDILNYNTNSLTKFSSQHYTQLF